MAEKKKYVAEFNAMGRPVSYVIYAKNREEALKLQKERAIKDHLFPGSLWIAL